MICSIFSFEVCFVTIFKSDVILLKFVIRIKHFDVSIMNRNENMTSADGIIQLDNESEVNRKKGNPEKKEEPD